MRIARDVIMPALAGSAEARMFVDDGSLGLEGNAARAWRWAAEEAGPATTHVLVTQDDVIPCHDFLYGLAQCFRHAPGCLLGLMDWTKASDEARERGVHWVESNGNAMGGAIACEAGIARQIFRWINWHLRDPDGRWPKGADDGAISAACRALGIRTLHPVPCLVQHALPSASVIGNNNANRVCRWVLGPTDSAVDVDWEVGRLCPVVHSGTLSPRKWAEQTFRDFSIAKKRSRA